MNKTTQAIPSIFTLANLLLGVLALIYTQNQEWQLAAIMILGAMVLDGMDGRLARRLEATSAFGKELDSLCDLVSFGVAPALLAYSKVLHVWSTIGMIIAIIFSLCGAIRLARFNILNITGYFVGVPITAAGSLVALLILAGHYLHPYVYPVAMLLLSFLMVSNIKVPKY